MKWERIGQIMLEYGIADFDEYSRNVGVRFTKLYTDYCTAHNRPRLRTSPQVYQRSFAMGFTHGMVVWAVLRFAAGVASAWSLVYVSAWCIARLQGNRVGVVFAGVGSGVALAGLVCLVLAKAGASSAER